ncbi:MAG: capsular biosynthesis protein, partial [Firmicutes bacterium]|nr:capsular biosynthesis protein [Bacillota bacterium]
LLGAASLVSGLFNYLYHVVLAHVLGPRSYGDLATLLNLTSILLIPLPVVTLVFTRLGRRPAPQQQRAARRLWLAGVALWLGAVAAGGLLGRTFNLPPGLVPVFTLEVVPSLPLAANLGLWQHARRYLRVGLLDVMLNAFRVVAAGVAGLSRSPLLLVGILEALAAWATWWASRGTSRLPVRRRPASWRLVAGTATAGTVNALFALSDGLVAKARLPAVAAGRYTGLATIGHTVPFLSGSVATVMLTAILARPDRHGRYLGVTLAVYALLALGAEGLFAGAGAWLIRTVLGAGFLPLAPLLPPYGWGMMAQGFLNILMLYAVARRNWLPVLTAAAGWAAWTAWLTRAGSPAGFVSVTLATMLPALALSALVVGLTYRKGGPAAGRTPLETVP